MTPAASLPLPHVPDRIFGWPRVRVVLVTSAVLFFLFIWGWKGTAFELAIRLVMLGLVQVAVFGVLERWPARLPGWMARWVLQVIGVAVVVPFAMAIIYSLTTMGDEVSWVHDKERMSGYGMFCGLGILIAPGSAMSALYRHISGQAQRQALAFELERSELERNAAETRLNLLSAQVEPHFLFNTLANVRELVDSGSPQASSVLDSLIAYLRAAVPRLHEREATLGQEVQLVRAYLELMHLRMQQAQPRFHRVALVLAAHQVEGERLPLRVAADVAVQRAHRDPRRHQDGHEGEQAVAGQALLVVGPVHHVAERGQRIDDRHRERHHRRDRHQLQHPARDPAGQAPRPALEQAVDAQLHEPDQQQAQQQHAPAAGPAAEQQQAHRERGDEHHAHAAPRIDAAGERGRQGRGGHGDAV